MRPFAVRGDQFVYSPGELTVSKDDLVKITVRSEDDTHSFVVDGYRIMKRVPANGSTTFEFRADKPGTFAFYSNMTSDARHADMRGELIVRPR